MKGIFAALLALIIGFPGFATEGGVIEADEDEFIVQVWLDTEGKRIQAHGGSLFYENGYITIPDKPGLGIEIDEEKCAEHPYSPHTLRHYTGALTDIRPAKTEFYF